MAKLKTLYYCYAEIFGEQDFFFDSKFNLLAWWDHNDATFRQEYMGTLIAKLGYVIENIPPDDSRIHDQIIDVLKECGMTEDENAD